MKNATASLPWRFSLREALRLRSYDSSFMRCSLL
jgi:hypothetical protein